MIHLEFWPTLAFVVVMLSWFAFIILFLVRHKPPPAPESKRERASILGIVLQGAGYGIVWLIRRAWFGPIVSVSNSVEIAIAILTMALGIASVWFVSAAIRTLGKQWSLGARLIEGHKLITGGPYRLVRNPIYTGMFGMLLATGLAVSHWVGLLIAIIVYDRDRGSRAQRREAFAGSVRRGIRFLRAARAGGHTVFVLIFR